MRQEFLLLTKIGISVLNLESGEVTCSSVIRKVRIMRHVGAVGTSVEGLVWILRAVESVIKVKGWVRIVRHARVAKSWSRVIQLVGILEPVRSVVSCTGVIKLAWILRIARRRLVTELR